MTEQDDHSNDIEEPRGELAIRALAMPADTNPNGDIFGGWVVSKMDLAGLSVARHHTKSKVVTVAINQMVFIAPVRVGDFVCCHAEVLKIGRTSMTIRIQVWAVGENDERHHKVTEGEFVYVSVDKNNHPKPIKK